MKIENIYQPYGITPKSLSQLILVLGLAAFAVLLIEQQIAIALGVICLPILLIIIIYGLVVPRFIYIIYATYAFFFTTISRYLFINQLSAGLEAILLYGFVALCLHTLVKKDSIPWRNAINLLTISYIPWIIFIIFQFANPSMHSEGLTFGTRIWIFRTLALYIFLSIFSDTYRALRIGLNLISFFALLAFIKLLWQKYIGFDYAEQYWLYVEGGATTHIIFSGIRYFSYFTDAANFGCIMAAIGFVYAIVSIHHNNRIVQIYYLFISITSFLSMFISGTRGAIIVPFAGAMLYCLLCKNIRIFATTGVLGLLIFSFFAFTTIGDGNNYIRRARTAFKSSEDASMNVRVKNREEIAYFISQHPLGAGISGSIPKLWAQEDGTYKEGTLPPDSYFVDIWIQTGYIGLFLFISICATMIIGSSVIVLFKIRDPYIRNSMAALTCATFGIWASGYTGNNPGMPPTDFLIAAMMAFVMNGKRIEQDYLNIRLSILKQ